MERNYSCKEPSMLYSKICGHKGWNKLLIHMIEDFPLLLDAGNVTNIEKVVSIAFDTPPIGLRVSIPCVAEVVSRGNGYILKVDLLMQIRHTKLFSYVSTWLETKVGNGVPSGIHQSAGDVLVLLLFGMPKIIWSHIQEEKLRQEITSLVSVYKFPLLQEEVLNLRRELEFLMIDLLSASISKSK